MFFQHKTVIEKPVAVETSTVKPIIVNGKLINIEADGLLGFQSQDELDFFKESIVYLADAFSSDEFKEKFLALHPTETNGHDLTFIYHQLLSGWDQAIQKEDGVINFYFSLYAGGASRTIGYTYGFQKIWTARYWFQQWYEKRDHAWMAGHLAHEYFHCMGYFHRYSHEGTLVYDAGYLVTQVINDLKKSKGEKTTELQDEQLFRSAVD